MSRKKAKQKMKKAPQGSLHTKSYLVTSLAITVFVIAVFVIFFIVGTEDDLNKVTVPRDIQVQIAALSEEEKVPVGSFQINMNNKWAFPSAKSTSKDAYVSNYIGNTHAVYFTLALADSEEGFYTSPHIPVGGTLENITLDCELPAGTHEAVLTYHLMEPDGTEYSTLSVSVEITILK